MVVFNESLILKTINIMHKVEVNSLIRLERGSKENKWYSVFKVLYKEPNWQEIQERKYEKENIIRLIDEFNPNVMPYTSAKSLNQLKINFVKYAVDGYQFSDIDLIDKKGYIIK